jgi:hypothetical protein
VDRIEARTWSVNGARRPTHDEPGGQVAVPIDSGGVITRASGRLGQLCRYIDIGRRSPRRLTLGPDVCVSSRRIVMSRWGASCTDASSAGGRRIVRRNPFVAGCKTAVAVIVLVIEAILNSVRRSGRRLQIGEA